MVKFQKMARCVGLGGLIALMACGSAMADDGAAKGNMMVRLRGLSVLPTVTSTTTIGGDVNISKAEAPEIDFTYYITPNIAVEAIGATTRHHVTWLNPAGADVNLGKVSLLPPTVTAQYHFLTDSRISPYLGAGINYTLFYNQDASEGTVTKIHYENAFGLALQAGADVHIDGPWYANLDVKHIFLNTDVKMNGGAIKADVHIDPTIVGLGIGYRF